MNESNEDTVEKVAHAIMDEMDKINAERDTFSGKLPREQYLPSMRRYAQAAINLLPTGDAGCEWQPIETAPDDQKGLFWVVPDRISEDSTFLNMKAQIFFGRNKGWSSLLHATHWMPLPAPPEGRKGNRD